VIDRLHHWRNTTFDKMKRVKLPDIQDFLFSLQAKSLPGYTGSNASAIGRPARVADQSRENSGFPIPDHYNASQAAWLQLFSKQS